MQYTSPRRHLTRAPLRPVIYSPAAPAVVAALAILAAVVAAATLAAL